MSRRALAILVVAVVLLVCAAVLYVVGPAQCGSSQTWTVRHGCFPGADAR